MSKNQKLSKQTNQLAYLKKRSFAQSIALVVGVNIFAIAIIAQILVIVFMLLVREFDLVLLVSPVVVLLVGYVLIRLGGVRLSRLGEVILSIVTSVI